MVKTELRVKREMIDDKTNFVPYLENFVAKINYSYGKKFSIHSWEIDTREDDELDNVKTVELSLK